LHGCLLNEAPLAKTKCNSLCASSDKNVTLDDEHYYCARSHKAASKFFGQRLFRPKYWARHPAVSEVRLRRLPHCRLIGRMPRSAVPIVRGRAGLSGTPTRSPARNPGLLGSLCFKTGAVAALLRNDAKGQFQTSLSRRIDKPSDFVSQFRKSENLAQKSVGMEIAAELLSRLSASFNRSLSSQRHHVILRAGGAAYADGHRSPCRRPLGDYRRVMRSRHRASRDRRSKAPCRAAFRTPTLDDESERPCAPCAAKSRWMHTGNCPASQNKPDRRWG
jgi:hypothetical protein